MCRPVLRQQKQGGTMITSRPSIIHKDKNYKAIECLLDNALLVLKEIFQPLNNAGYSIRLKKKSYSSCKEKLVRKNLSNYLSLTDLVKGVVIVNDVDSIILVTAFLKGQLDTSKVEVKLGSNVNPYKGVIHLDVVMGGVTCEIQVMTQTTWDIKCESNVYYKNDKALEGKFLWDKADNFSHEQLKALSL